MLAALGIGAVAASATVAPPYAPYGPGAAANDIYNLLFCDDPIAFKPKAGQQPVDWQRTLFAEPPDPAQLRALAHNASEEGRVRYLAFTKLRTLGEQVPPRLLLGVIVEVPLSGGLDVLAAFSEGGVRYINQTGKLAVLEDVAQVQPLVQQLFVAAEPVVARIGPWDQARRAPPAARQIRLSFLVSDGLYFGEGPMSVMQRDGLAGPVIQRATALLQAVVPLAR